MTRLRNPSRPAAAGGTAYGLPATEVVAVLRSATAPPRDPRLDTVLFAIRHEWEMIARVRYPRLGAETTDAIQTAFTKLLTPRNLDALIDPARVGPWARCIFVNTAIDMLRDTGRRRDRRAPAMAEDRGEDPYEHLPSPQPGPEDLMRARELATIVARRLQGVTAARLRWVDELSEREVAARLGTTRDAIATRLKRLRQRLREDLEG